MGFDGVGRTRQRAGYLLVGLTRSQPLQDFMLPPRDTKRCKRGFVALEACAGRRTPPHQRDRDPGTKPGKTQRDKGEKDLEPEGTREIAVFQPFQRKHANGKGQRIQRCRFPHGTPVSQTTILPALP